MQDTVTTSWRRRSDESRKDRDSASPRRAQVPPVHVTEAQQLETWEDEGGRPGLCTQPVRILIVDNDISSSGSLEAMLHASGHSEIRVAYSGHAALAIAAEFQPSVVLLELNLLDMSGFEVARLLRGQAQRHDLRLIALTPSREHAGRELPRMAGFERYLLKPVVADELASLFPVTAAEKPIQGKIGDSLGQLRSPTAAQLISAEQKSPSEPPT
jgi:CheY-like chemotaxis protein